MQFFRSNSVKTLEKVPLDGEKPCRKRSCPHLRSCSANGESKENELPASTSSSSAAAIQSDFFLDECRAVLQQVPDSFDLGLTPVGLCSVAASPSGAYLATGSQCGALFLYNRRLGQGVKPLRTNYTEVLSHLLFHWSPESGEQLAVGHQSGSIVLLRLPSEQNPKMAQHVQEEAHRGSRLSAFGWTSDGRVLFSGDQSGLLLATRVDFEAEMFPVEFVASEQHPISAVAIHAERLAFASGCICRVLNWQQDFAPLANLDFGGTPNGQVISLTFCKEGRLNVLRRDGKNFGLDNGGVEEEQLGDLHTSLSAEQQAIWQKEDFAQANVTVDPSGECLVVWQKSSLLFCRLWPGGFGLETVELAAQLGVSNIEIVSVCSPSINELFVLALPRRLLRLGRLEPASSTLTAAPSPPPAQTKVLGPLFAASRAVSELGKKRAQKLLPVGTDQLLGRFNRELDVFLMGDTEKSAQQLEEKNNSEVPRLAERLAANFVPLPEPEKLAQGFQQMLGQLRQSSSIISAEFDHWSLAGTSRDFSRDRPQRDSSANRSLPTELSPSLDDDREELLSLLGDDGGQGKAESVEGENAVRIRRRRITQNRSRQRGRQLGRLRALAEERASKASALDLEEVPESANIPMLVEDEAVKEERDRQIMNALSRMMRNGQENEDPISRMKDEDIPENVTFDREEPKALANGWTEPNRAQNASSPEMAHQQNEWQNQEETTTNFDENNEEKQSLENGFFLPEKQRQPKVLDLSELLAEPASAPPVASSTASSSLLISQWLRPCFHFQAVVHFDAALTDQWNRLDSPFLAIGHLGLCHHYLVACSRKRGTHRPQFLMTGALLGAAGSQWNPLRIHAEAVVPNESGTRVWRIWSGIGYSPARAPDPLTPSWCLSKCPEWCEMTSPNEGRLLQVVLTEKHAWYLTDRGVFVQMCLPENGIGIWFRAQEDEGPPSQFTHLAASENAVWALNGIGQLSVRTGLRHCPMGIDWVEMDGQPRKFIKVVLFRSTGFGLDSNGSLWFVHGVAHESPFGVGPWFKVPPLTSALSSVKLAPVKEWRLQVGTVGVFLAVGASLLHSTILSGHCFEHVVPERLVDSDHFATLAAGGFSGITNDCLFACPPHSGELLAYSLRTRNFTPLLPSVPNIRAFTASSDWLLVLSQDGIVHARSLSCCFMVPTEEQQWIQFGQPAKFASVAISATTLWAISEPDNAIWVCHFRPVEGFDRLDWHQIDCPTNGKDRPNQMRISPSGQSLWLFSSATGNAWSRTDLSARNWRGRSWIQQEGLYVMDLAVADTAVWALDKQTGELHRFVAGSSTKLRMDSANWRSLDFRLNAISVDSLEERLWALDTEFRIVRLQMDIFPRTAVNDANNGNHLEILQKTRELPERTLSGGSPSSWCDLGK